MSGEPLVSVVMAARNAGRHLREALESVRLQTYQRYEVVLVDGGSTDTTREIARSYSFVRVLEQDGRGFAAAWNAGVEQARGGLVALLDADDRWAPGKLTAQVDALANDPRLDYVLGKVRFVLEPGLPPPPGFRPALLEAARVAPMPGALLARRDVFETVGPFGTRWSIASDIDWFARLKDAGLRYAVVPEVVIVKRVHDSNLSYFAAGALNTELVQLLRESVNRRRGGS